MSSTNLEALSDVIDMDDLMTRCLGNLSFAEKILTVFQSRCEADLVELDEAVAAGDVTRIEKLAHRLKGACANAGATKLSRQAGLLWSAAVDQAPEEIAERLSKLRVEWDRCSPRLPSAPKASVGAM